MTIAFVKRVASDLMHRGVNSIRIAPASYKEVEEALTRDDVRKLIKSGAVLALKEKHNVSARSKRRRQKRSEGRSRGTGRRRGTRKVRQGVSWEKKVRSQRALLKKLKAMGRIDRKTFTALYGQVKGNAYADKATLLLHLAERGIRVSDEELKAINEEARKRYI